MTAIEPHRENRSLVRLATSGVAVDVSLDGPDRYAVRVAGPGRDVRARLMARMRDGSVVELGALEVPLGSAGASRFPMVVSHRSRLDHVFLDVCGGDDLRLQVVAPQPSPKRSPRMLLLGAACIAIGTSTTAGAAIAAAWPHAPQLAAPAQAIAGQRVNVLYAAAGVVQYQALRDDGTPIAHGSLPAGRGSFAFDLAPEAAGHRVDVRVRAATVLGQLTSDASFPVSAPRPTPMTRPFPPRIAAFSARLERDGSGTSVLASYLAVGDHGELRLLDQHRRTVAQAEFTHVGTQRLAIPGDAALGTLTASLTIRRGTEHVSSDIVLARPQAPPSIVPVLPAGPPTADAISPALAASGDPVTVVGRPIAGKPLDIAILRQGASMHLRLEDDAGNPVDEVDVPRGQTRATLRTPNAATASTYYLNCFYDTGGGQEVVVRPIHIAEK